LIHAAAGFNGDILFGENKNILTTEQIILGMIFSNLYISIIILKKYSNIKFEY